MTEQVPPHETKHLALLTLAEGWLELTPDERANGIFWANPIISSQQLYDECVDRYATDEQIAVLRAWVKDGLLVLSETPGKTRNALRTPTMEVNRRTRRTDLKGKG